MTEEIKLLSGGWYLVESTTGERTAGPYVDRDDAERELAWHNHDHEGDLEYDLERESDHATGPEHDAWQVNEGRMWDR